MLEEIWTLGLKLSLGFFGAMWLVGVLIQIAHIAKSWVSDEDIKVMDFFDKFIEKIFGVYAADFVEFVMFFGIIGILGIFAGALIWPLVYACLIVYGILYALRYSIRFKKKINEAMKSKADKKHKHNQDDIILNED